MKIECEPLLDVFRQSPRCEWCNAHGPCDPAHILARGMGGGGRMDIPCNLVTLCRECHTEQHAGHRPLPCDLVAIVAARYGVLQDDIQCELWRARAAKKGFFYVCIFTRFSWLHVDSHSFSEGDADALRARIMPKRRGEVLAADASHVWRFF